MMIFPKKTVNIFLVSFFILLVFSPLLTLGAPADTSPGDLGITYECKDGDCTFEDLVAATKKVTDYGAAFALMFSVVVIAYAGFKYMISGANAKERTEANAMLVKVLWGIGFILAAWLIVTLILNSLGVEVQFTV